MQWLCGTVGSEENKHHLEEINSDLSDLIGQAVDNKESEIDDDDDNNKMIENDKQEYCAE
ncbi:19295_t:CDS:2 [Racocetra persica]|uniref:19295_t:CDS:1 n=1 Tax=Racocetra persica TaxID=160502 RepID=A0ACA9KJ13_9GLOM|nr:19295_t:CDS:2 [Racocetra persica]